MKPTKMRNNLIYQATFHTKSKQLGSALSKDLHKKYGKRSVRVIEGDSVTIVRGEFKGVDGKVAKISKPKSSVAIEGVKKEKTKGDKFDVYIHTSNLVVTSLSTEDKWRIAKLENKDASKQSKTTSTKTEAEKVLEETLQEQLSGEKTVLAILSKVYFDSDSAELKPEAAEGLTESLTELLKSPSQKIILKGHTDSTNTEAYNLELSIAASSNSHGMADW